HRFTGELDVYRGPPRRAAPGGERRTPQRGRHDARDLPFGAGDELLDQVRHRTLAGYRAGLRLPGQARVPQRAAEPVERLPLAGGEMGEQGMGVAGAVLDRAAVRAEGC